MDESGFLASAHRRVVDESIRAVLDEVACDMGDLERNIVGIALRQEVETRLVPELLALHALLLGADAEMLGWLPGVVGPGVHTPLPADAEFLTEMGRVGGPAGYDLLEEKRCAFARGVGGVQEPLQTACGAWRPEFPAAP